MPDCDVAVVGAGPYGLSAGAHLRQLEGLEVRVFGDPMSFWEHHMPRGMVLRSPRVASHIPDPERRWTLDAYEGANGNHPPLVNVPPSITDESVAQEMRRQIPLEHFIQYAHWFRQQAGLHVDRRKVLTIDMAPDGYRLTLQDGETLGARRVVVAAGVEPFARRPKLFEGFLQSQVSHTSRHHDLGKFRDREVLVIGGGQSALESAALMHEAGAAVEVLVREPVVRWLHRVPWLHKWPVAPLLYAPPEVGPAMVSHLTARPNWFRRLPRRWQDRLRPRSIRPAGARWLKPRLNGVPIRTGQSVVSVAPVGERIHATLGDGTERRVDHVLLGTGYHVDISRYAFLSPKLLESVRRTDGYPQLDVGLETSVPGLHFLGAPAAWSFGPLMWFVAGAEFAARVLVRRVLEERPRARQAMTSPVVDRRLPRSTFLGRESFHGYD